VGETGTVPDKFSIAQNYPNPFNPTTAIQYDLPRSSNVTLEVFDILGRKVERLVDANQQAGRYRVTWNAKDVLSGIYFYKIQAGEFSETKKMLLLK
jgi:hypothetical protein